jgi:hypothetical protein
MRGSAGPFGRIAVDRKHHLGTELVRPCDRRVEVINLEPQEHAVALRLRVRITHHRAVVVLDLPVVQLQDQALAPPGLGNLALRIDEAFVFRSAVNTVASEKALIPAAARFDIPARD